eukprot:gene1934-2198_t
MPKKFRLIESTLPPTTREHTDEETDWERCIICQDNPSEVLQCPADSSRSDAGVGYIRFEENFTRFDELGALLVKIEAKRLDNGSSISKTLLENKAKWHKSCNFKFNSTMLERAEKKGRSNDAAEEPSTKNDMSAYRGGRDVVLAFNKGIGSAVLKASSIDHDEDAIILSKAAKIVR